MADRDARRGKSDRGPLSGRVTRRNDAERETARRKFSQNRPQRGHRLAATAAAVVHQDDRARIRVRQNVRRAI